jgi:hypothetical protein
VWARGLSFDRLASQARLVSTNDGGVVNDTVEFALASIGVILVPAPKYASAQDDAGSDFPYSQATRKQRWHWEEC